MSDERRTTMPGSIKRLVSLLISACAASLLLTGGASAADKNVVYNTGERALMAGPALLMELQNAQPLPMPTVVMPAGALTIPQAESLPADAQPGVSAGWSPGSGLPQPSPMAGYTISKPQTGFSLQTFGSAPTDPLNGPYAPFQRWTWYGNYAAQWTQTIGKLYFDTNGDGTRDAYCTATVIGTRTIATAAHCLHSGGPSGNWYGNFLFCPSYYKAGGSGGPYPGRGCWGWSGGAVSLAWVSTSGGDVDRDYACLVTALTGDTVADKVGNITGWVGRAYNYASSQPVVAWGYPGGAPFPGYNIIVATSPEWYEVDMVPGDGQVSKYIGNDMTGGSSGGPWWMSVSHQTLEYNDTDGLGTTDPPGCAGCVPGGPYLNGVNSHKRCLVNCNTPPTATNGIFWQEMGSAQFRNTVNDTDESEDVFLNCLSQE